MIKMRKRGYMIRYLLLQMPAFLDDPMLERE